LVIDPILHSQLLQLCTQGFLERKTLRDSEPSLLSLLNDLGISVTQAEHRLEIESALELINLESIQAHFKPVGEVGAGERGFHPSAKIFTAP
jgi:hypothetical protein